MDKESKDLEAKRVESEAQDKEARQKAGQSRRAICEHTTASASLGVEVIEESDPLSDMEAVGPVAMGEDNTMVQAQKKLRASLSALLTKIPDTEADTPRRRADKQEASPPS